MFDFQMSSSIIFFFTLSIFFLTYHFLLLPLVFHPLGQIPGPKIYAVTKWRLALDDFRGTRTRKIKALHDIYGDVVRVGPGEVSFASLTALKSIYNGGSESKGFGRTGFYDMFDVYGRKNLFTFAEAGRHAERKRLLSHMYSNSSVTAATKTARLVEEKVVQYLKLLEREPDGKSEVFTSLHYFSLDAIADFVYGKAGRTEAMKGDQKHRRLLVDILDPARRRLSWFAIHLPSYTKWVLSQSGFRETLVTVLGLLPMRKPTTYTGIRKHALEAFYRAKDEFDAAQKSPSSDTDFVPAIIRLLEHRSRGGTSLEDLDIASECADHLLAGVDTTADSLMFLFWALSLPEHAAHQHRLREELRSVTAKSTGAVDVKVALALPFLDAVIKETLRLYNPLPATEPRSNVVDTVIDGYRIPAGTVVGSSPYVLHRNPQAYPDPLVWDPERWTGGRRDTGEAARRWFWGFSSGARMCIGSHLAMAEMACLVASVYKLYETSLPVDHVNDVTNRRGTPAVTSRFELFYDVVKAAKHGICEHECQIVFKKAD